MDILINNKLNFDFKTNQQILKMITFIDTFKGKWNITEAKENRYLQELRKIATIESIGSSTRIEGVVLTNLEIEKIINNLNINNLKTRDEQEVVGYWETLDTVVENYKYIKLTENFVKQLHSILLKYSDKNEKHKGNYKQLSNKVVATYPDGNQKVIFKTTEPHLVDKEMLELIEWTNESFKNQEIHPLLIISTFVYEFLSIHPFQDGNGRLSRLLTTLLLLQQDYLFVQYVSFENIIEIKKKEYYKALMEGQKDRYSDKELINTWTVFFLECIQNLIQNQVSTDLISMQIYDKSFDFNKFNPNIEFVKWAALEVSDFENIPENLETYILKGGLYAVFHYVGSSEFAAEIFNYIFNTWIPQSEYNIDQREHFEILGEKYKNNDSNSEEEIWIPIIKKF